MKQTVLCGIAALLASFQVKAQTEKFTGLSLHATFGAKQINYNSKFADGAETPTMATSLGAGSYWNIHRTVVGTEFYYSSGSSTTNSFATKYAGFNSNLYFGYQVIKSKGWQIAPLVGIGSSKNQILIAAKGSTYNSQGYHNSAYMIHTALRIENVNRKGTYFALKGGFNYSLSNPNWKVEGTNNKTSMRDKPCGFYLQLNVGGLIKLKNHKS